MKNKTQKQILQSYGLQELEIEKILEFLESIASQIYYTLLSKDNDEK